MIAIYHFNNDFSITSADREIHTHDDKHYEEFSYAFFIIILNDQDKETVCHAMVLDACWTIWGFKMKRQNSILIIACNKLIWTIFPHVTVRLVCFPSCPEST